MRRGRWSYRIVVSVSYVCILLVQEKNSFNFEQIINSSKVKECLNVFFKQPFFSKKFTVSRNAAVEYRDRRRKVLPVPYFLYDRSDKNTELRLIQQEVTIKEERIDQMSKTIGILWREMRPEDISAIQDLLSSDDDDDDRDRDDNGDEIETAPVNNGNEASTLNLNHSIELVLQKESAAAAGSGTGITLKRSASSIIGIADSSTRLVSSPSPRTFIQHRRRHLFNRSHNHRGPVNRLGPTSRSKPQQQQVCFVCLVY